MGLGFGYVVHGLAQAGDVLAELGWTPGRAFSAAGGLLLLSMALASPVIGSLTDRFGPRRVLALSTLLLAAALASFGAMQSLPHFYATSLLFGLALTGLGDIPVGALAARWVDRSLRNCARHRLHRLEHRRLAGADRRDGDRRARVLAHGPPLALAAAAIRPDPSPCFSSRSREPRADERSRREPRGASVPGRVPTPPSLDSRRRARPPEPTGSSPPRYFRLLLLLPRRDRPPDRVPLGPRLLGCRTAARRFGGAVAVGIVRQARDRRARGPDPDPDGAASRTSRW